MRIMWSVPVEEYWSEAQRDVAGHRFFPLLEILAGTSPDRAGRRAAFLDRLTRLELEPVEIDMFRILQQSRNKNAMMARSTAERHIDPLDRDFSEVIQSSWPKDKVPFAQMLLEVSPDALFSMATLIEHDWKTSAPLAAEWEKRTGDSP
jgi:hypothetical protein